MARNTRSRWMRDTLSEEIFEDFLFEGLQGDPERLFTISNSPEQGERMDTGPDNGEDSSTIQQLATEAAAEEQQRTQGDTGVQQDTGAGIAPLIHASKEDKDV